MLLPDGRTFLYTRGAPGSRAVHVGSLDLTPEEQSTTPLLTTEYGATFARMPGGSPDAGRVLFVRDGTLLAQPLDIAQRQLVGEPVVVAEQVLFTNGRVVAFDYYSASELGMLVYKSGIPPGRVRQLAWFDRQGKPLGVLSELARDNTPKLSPDATRAVTSRTDLQTGNNADLWLTDLKQDTSTRLTFGGGANVQPAWSPDGTQVAWVRSATPPALYRKSADGAGAEELLYTFESGPSPNLTDWSADGRFLVFACGGDVWTLPVGDGTDSSRKPVPVVQGPGTQGQQAGSSGAAPVGGKWMVSRGTQGFARWRSDGRELLFIGADGALLMAVDVTSASVFKASAPCVLFQLPQSFLALSANPGAVADVTRDHQPLLLLMPADTRQELFVVANWQNGLSP